ncbi:hypothetical protein BGZ83_000262 [Gryganskiella cystojenkinii]|nr:hypothetical protein BGZ83_000262 [Gryganskiella cystojenkinii]
MKFSLKAVALGALLASAAVAAPIDVEKRDANSDRIAACFVGLIFTGAWPGSCQAAIAVNLGLIRSIAINQMSMDFTPSNPWAPTTSSNSVVATMLSIPGVSLPIDSVRQHIILVDNGVQLGNIDTPWSAANVNGGTLTTSFTTSTLNVFSTSHNAFTNFISALSTTSSHPVTLQGAVDVKLNLGIFGHMTLPGIGFKATTQFQGLNNLQNMKYIYQVSSNIDFVANTMTLYSIISIHNPTNLSLKLGNLNLNTAGPAGYVGNSTITGFSLVPGDNNVVSTSIWDMQLPATQTLLQNLLDKDQTLLLTGYAQTSTNVALNAGLAAMKSNLLLPGGFAGLTISQTPYLNWSLKTTPTTNQDLGFEITATFQSPFYGFPLEMVQPVVGPQALAQVRGVSTDADSTALFYFTELKYKVQGNQQSTVTFKALMKNRALEAGDLKRWTDIVAYGKAHGKITVNLLLNADMIFNSDGVVQNLDLSTLAIGLLNGVDIAVGDDLASVLAAIPTA